LLTSTLLEKDADGWYYPENIIQHKQENIIAFLCLLTNKPALKKFHKYIDNLLFKQGNLIINYRDEAIEDELW
jgi:predicted transcriptional regulator YheO